jgi:preprotein translocase subunit SecY
MNSDLMRRAAVTLAALLVYRIGTYIPLPGIDPGFWEFIFNSQSSGLLRHFNAFAGGGLGRTAVLALNLIPYITAAWLVQLLVLFSPKIRAINERGDSGRRKIHRYVLGLTLLLAALQSYGIAQGLEGAGDVVANPGLFFRVVAVVALTGGTFFLIWLSEFITVRGLGNGLALILSVGILTQVPQHIATTFELLRQGVLSDATVAGVAIFAIVLIGFIVFIEMARRHVPIEYERRQIGDRIIEKRSSTLALKLNGAGMIPVVVARWPLSILLPIAYIANLDGSGWLSSIAEQLGRGQRGFILYFGIAIVVLALFYVALLIDTDRVAETLRQERGVIPGIDPGAATADYIDQVLSRITILGAVYLAFVYLVPEILNARTQRPIYLGGVSALIVVCTVLDILHEVQVRTRMENRETHK